MYLFQKYGLFDTLFYRGFGYRTLAHIDLHNLCEQLTQYFNALGTVLMYNIYIIKNIKHGMLQACVQNELIFGGRSPHWTAVQLVVWY